MSYTHLTQEERYQIYAYKKTGKSTPEIGLELGRNKSSIYRELKRNTGGRGYRPKQANGMALVRLSNTKKTIKMVDEVVTKIEEKIRLDWSPEQVSGRLLKEEGISISHETIYQHILKDKKDGGFLYTHLRCQKKRRKRYGSKSRDKRGQIKDRVSIESRPKVVDKKSRIGDWEGDLVIGKNHKGALVTLADRKSKKVKIAKIDSKNAGIVDKAVFNLLKDEKVITITFDNGKEFSHHKSMAKKLDARIFFAHPYSSWERGLNENTNGIIRQYFRKGSSFENLTDKDAKVVEKILNNRPRKTLGFNTPNEIYSGQRRTLKIE
jgi:IS30 family transposase